MIRAPIRVDDEVGDEIGAGWLDEDVNLLGRSRSTLGIGNDPAHRIAGRNRLGRRIIVADLRRLERRAASERRNEQYETTGLRPHQPSSFDQLMAWTNTPSGFLRRRSASCGASITTVRIAVQRSVAARLPFS